MTDVAPRYTSIPIRHPHLAIYLIGLLVAWTVTTMTWTRSGGGRIELQPLAQVLQYLLVILAAVLAGDRLIRASMRREEADDATFGFYEHRWTVKRDLSGRVWWTCVWAGMAASVRLEVESLKRTDHEQRGPSGDPPTSP